MRSLRPPRSEAAALSFLDCSTLQKEKKGGKKKDGASNLYAVRRMASKARASNGRGGCAEPGENGPQGGTNEGKEV